MDRFDPDAYGAKCALLLNDLAPGPLDAGEPRRAMRSLLQGASVQELAAGRAIADHDMARCCLAALWLQHNYLDESHAISQQIPSTSGSYWHGIMHRREGDFSNAKYWFRRVGRHPVFDALAARQPHEQETPVPAGWDPLRFVDRCQAALRKGESERQQCEALAHVEWQLLFDYCYRQAFGSG